MTDATTAGTSEPSGQHVIITGAASGIGRAAAGIFATRGAAALALIDIDVDGLDGAAAGLRDAHPDVRVVTHTADVGNAGQLSAAFDSIVAELGRIHHMVNNAARMTGPPEWPAVDADHMAQVVDVNLMSVLVGTRLAHAHMAATGGGSIISTASGAGKVPLPSDPLYGATKAAVIMLTRASAPTFAAEGIRINAVCPSMVDTPMLAGSVEGRPELAAQLERMPVLSAHEVATALVDLACDPTRTGETPSVLPAAPT